MESSHVLTIADVRKAGLEAGAQAEEGLALYGQGIVAALVPVIKALPRGEASSMITAFWEAFEKAGPHAAKVRRVAVTRSESLRICAGIDAGLPYVDSWNDAVKAAPKRSAAGRKPRPTSGTGGAPPDDTADTADSPTVVPSVPKGSSPAKFVRQQAAMLAAFMVKHRETLPEGYSKAIATFAATVEKLPVPADE